MNKVSIITPTYNSEKYICQTIDSIKAQTYENWEMIITDDSSNDSTCHIIEKYAQVDSRIKLLRNEVNLGAAQSRNRSLKASSGRFIAYIDADDIWKPTKLEKQIFFMLDKNYGFTCTSYEKINEKGEKLNKRVHMLPMVDYEGFLLNNILQTLGIMVDTSLINKKLLEMPDIRRRQDAATWLQILKAGHICYGIDEILAEYRTTPNSLSSNKNKAIKGMWNLYRNVEHLSLPFSCYCFVRYAILALWKRIYL